MEAFNWDLHAIVSGCNSEGLGSMIEQQQEQFVESLNSIELNELCFSFPDIFETPSYFDELEKLYKPFYPSSSNDINPISLQSCVQSSSMNGGVDEVKEQEKLHLGSSMVSSSSSPSSSSHHAPKYKRSRKNQTKTVVQQVAADGTLASDIWAWRKYGQKPIKGSPHPRSYYRCSSSKGCSARKQVERSQTDAGIFIITYTAEHNHSHPTRRNSLAGSTRNKFPKPHTAAGNDSKDKCSPAGVVSPATPKFVQRSTRVKRDEDQMLIPKITLRDEMFSSLEEFGEPNLPDQSWFINESTSVGGGC